MDYIRSIITQEWWVVKENSIYMDGIEMFLIVFSEGVNTGLP